MIDDDSDDEIMEALERATDDIRKGRVDEIKLDVPGLDQIQDREIYECAMTMMAKHKKNLAPLVAILALAAYDAEEATTHRYLMRVLRAMANLEPIGPGSQNARN